MMTPDNSSAQNLVEQYGRLVSYSLPCPGVDLLDFVAHGKGQPRFYWESVRDGIGFAGLGTAVELMSWSGNRFASIQEQARALFDGAEIVSAGSQPDWAAPRLFGGFAFLDDFVPDHIWADFAPAYFVLPHFQLVRAGSGMWLTINTNIGEDESIEDISDALYDALFAKIAELQQIRRDDQNRAASVEEIDYPMSFETWADNVTDATQRMKRGELNKIVLSRMAEVRFAGQVDVDGALRYLAQHYGDTYRFLFEPRAADAFYGATPELLVHTTGDNLNTMALAGSIRRGETPEEDAAFADELLNSAKDRHEHQIVIDSIRQRLQQVTSALEIGETGIMQLSNIQHIHTPISAQLNTPYSVLSVLERLHPTPALGGDPKSVALELMSELEPVPRGWYGAPVGWIDYKLDGQFGVAIRSAITRGRRVWMYAGAGIVEASDPQKEWDETALKFRPMLNALNITGDL